MAIKVSNTTVIDDSRNITNVGSFTATTFNGSGANLTNLPSSSGVAKIVASGSLSNGETVFLNSDGTVSSVSSSSSSFSAGSPVDFSVTPPSPAQPQSSIYDPVNNKVVVMYIDLQNSGVGKIAVGSVSGTSITFGTPVTYDSSSYPYGVLVFDSGQNKVLIIHQNSSNHGTATVGTISGNSISLGTPLVFYSTTVSRFDAVYVPSLGKTVCVFERSYLGYVVQLTISGTTVTSSGLDDFMNNFSYPRITYDSVNAKIIIGFIEQYSQLPAVLAMSVSGTTYTWGNKYYPMDVYASGGRVIPVFNPSIGKTIFIFNTGGDYNAGYYRLAMCMITNVDGYKLSLGPVSFISDGSEQVFKQDAKYSAVDNNVVLVYSSRTYDASNNATEIIKTASILASDNSHLPSFTQDIVYNQNTSAVCTLAVDTTNNKVVAFIARSIYSDNEGKSSGIVFQARDTGLTGQNFVGFSAGNYTNGQTASIRVSSAIDDQQTGLTPGNRYYVQSDGSISTTEGIEVAGTAVTSNKILVKG